MARILLIDDDDLVRAMLSQTLAHFGHVVTEARNGVEGLQMFAASGSDLVITDIVMPDKEGLEVVMELRAGPNPPRIIAMSGGGRQSPTDYLRLAKHLGASTVLSKPFSSETLMAAVNSLLGT
ncbi:MAG TPA: response regulator [Opitutaceae bacterium]|jgi:CheY-like chemotaxis protein|nr:response regulator [Opitutaceae bacterium]